MFNFNAQNNLVFQNYGDFSDIIRRQQEKFSSAEFSKRFDTDFVNQKPPLLLKIQMIMKAASSVFYIFSFF